MKVLITGVCGFVGSAIARYLVEQLDDIELVGIDNFSRSGSETNRAILRALGVDIRHGDVRLPGDLEALPRVDWIVDAAANPSVLAGVTESCTSRQVIETNLFGTVNLLELAKRFHAGFVLLSSSRVYSSESLAAIPTRTEAGAFRPDFAAPILGLSEFGIAESFSTAAPVSLYGSSKLASETMALEYGDAFDLPVIVNRCGAIAGAGQFGRPDQGIFAYWIHAHFRRRPLAYIGFDGSGSQVRDCLHPADLAALLVRQFSRPPTKSDRTINVGGGPEHAMSLAQLSDWCGRRFGLHNVGKSAGHRPYDAPWIVMDRRRSAQLYEWIPAISLDAILTEIADHATANPGWLEISGAT